MSWTEKIENLIERWRAEGSGRLPVESPFEVGSLPKGKKTAAAAAPRAEGLVALAEAVKEALTAFAAENRRDFQRVIEEQKAVGAQLAEAAGRAIGQLAESSKAAPAPSDGAVELRPEVAGLAIELKPFLDRLAEENRASLQKFADIVNPRMADLAEDTMVGRAALAKSVNNALAEIKQMLAGPKADGDQLRFAAEPMPAAAVEVQGRVGAFDGELGDAGRGILLSECFAAQVLDESMNPVIAERQTVLASGRLPARSGDIVVAEVGGKWVIKRYVKRGGQHQFQSINASLGLPAITLEAPPARMHPVVAVVFAGLPERAAAVSKAAAAAGAAEATGD